MDRRVRLAKTSGNKYQTSGNTHQYDATPKRFWAIPNFVNKKDGAKIGYLGTPKLYRYTPSERKKKKEEEKWKAHLENKRAQHASVHRSSQVTSAEVHTFVTVRNL